VIVLKAVRRWLDSPAWAPLLLNSSDPGGLQEQPAITLLADLVDAAGSSEQAFLQQELEGWRKEDDAPESVRQAALWMLIRLAVRQRKLLPDPGEECKYGIILLDVSQTGNRAMAETALQFVRELISRSFLHLSFETLVYRLGEALPAATWPQSLCPEDLISVEDCRHPLLATPILEIIPPGKAAFILCLANQEILDLEDWLDGWQNILLLHFCYGGRQPVYPASFVSIDFPMEPGSKFESAAAARTIIKKLFDVMK
jgi:hypothetical protein